MGKRDVLRSAESARAFGAVAGTDDLPAGDIVPSASGGADASSPAFAGLLLSWTVRTGGRDFQHLLRSGRDDAARPDRLCIVCVLWLLLCCKRDVLFLERKKSDNIIQRYEEHKIKCPKRNLQKSGKQKSNGSLDSVGTGSEDYPTVAFRNSGSSRSGGVQEYTREISTTARALSITEFCDLVKHEKHHRMVKR